MTVLVQVDDFDVGAELGNLRLANPSIGALVSFVGQVREFTTKAVNNGDSINSLTLEHYPEMTQKALESIENEAKARWELINTLIIHRVGTLKPQDQIVLVAVCSAHRGEAFKACEFIMDYLKTSAPFWKKEATDRGERWVEAKVSDDQAKARWK